MCKEFATSLPQTQLNCSLACNLRFFYNFTADPLQSEPGLRIFSKNAKSMSCKHLKYA